MKIRSIRSKGSSFEKKVGQLLGQWWQGEPFPRAHGSGSATTLAKGKVYESGDLYTSKNFPWSVECKKQEAWSFDQIFAGKGLFFSWLKQCFRDADKVGKIPMLCFSKNYSDVFVAVLSNDALNSNSSLWDLINYCGVYFFDYKGIPMLILPLKIFLEHCKPFVKKDREDL